VVEPGEAIGFVLLAPVMALAAIDHLAVWPLPAVNVPELPLPTTSTTHAPLVKVLMLVEIESAPLVSVCVVTASGPDCRTPKSETAPAAAPWIDPWKVTLTVYVPAAGRFAFRT